MIVSSTVIDYFTVITLIGTSMAKAKVAIVRTKPTTVLILYQRLCELGGLKQPLHPTVTTMKDNITWHNVFPCKH